MRKTTCLVDIHGRDLVYYAQMTTKEVVYLGKAQGSMDLCVKKETRNTRESENDE